MLCCGQLEVKSMQDRGVLDMDQQYNALNFCYFVDKGDGTHKRMVRRISKQLHVFANISFAQCLRLVMSAGAQ